MYPVKRENQPILLKSNGKQAYEQIRNKADKDMNIITLTINPAFDTHIKIDKFITGNENYAYARSRQAGGKGINVSRALSVNGVENTAFIIIGKKNGKEFEAALENDGVKYRAIYTEGEIRENITIHSDAETRISLEGQMPTDGEIFTLFDECQKNVKAGDVVVFSGRIPKGADKKKILDELRKLSDEDIKLIVDTNSFTLDETIYVKPYLIKPNKNELASLCGDFDDDAGAFRRAAEAARRGIGLVLLSLGSSGAALIGENGGVYARAPKIVAESTIGAGDSMLAGYIASIAAGNSESEALVSAVAWGSAKCLRDGTLPPIAADIEKFIKKIKVEKLESFACL